MPAPGNRPSLVDLFLTAAAGLDGQRLVAGALAAMPTGDLPTHVLAVGKVALPMWRGLGGAVRPGAALAALAVVPTPLVPAVAPDGLRIVAGDHPQPTDGSVAAARAAAAFVGSVDAAAGAGARLLVLLSGGASSLLCAPAGGLTLADKRAAVAAVAAGGATIAQLNTVRKHLSALKGGQLALHTRAPTRVLALSDVVGDDPATIGSGPFSPDPSTFEQALAIIAALGVTVPPAVRAHLETGARGQHAETPKPGDARLHHVAVTIVAGPDHARAQARAAAQAAGLPAGELWRNDERSVDALAAVAVDRARQALATTTTADQPLVLIGNGEPTIKVTGQGGGRGGRATHLGLLVARGLAALPVGDRARVSFLAAGTDDRDGNTDVSGALVSGETWARAVERGLSPQAALDRCDSLPLLEALGATVRGPGTSNLLDLHLLAVNLPLGAGRL